MLFTVPETPRGLGLPFDEWRKGQRAVVQSIVDWYLTPLSPKFFILEAPTGVGKSLIAAGVIYSLYLHRKAQGQQFIASVATASKSLQTQYDTGTFPQPEAAAEMGIPVTTVAWGRSNYECLIRPNTMADEGPCTAGYDCPEKGECPYYVMRDAAHFGHSAVFNTAFFLTGANKVRIQPGTALTQTDRPGQHTGLFTGNHLMIHDEAHLTESAIKSFVECSFDAEFYRQQGFPLPDRAEPQAWADVLADAKVKFQSMASAYESEARRTAKTGLTPGREFMQQKRARTALQTIDTALYSLLPQHPYIDIRDNRWKRMQAVWGTAFAQEMLWKHGDKHLLMSATIPDERYIARTLDIAAEDYEFHRLPSPFQPMKRRVVDAGRHRVVYRTEQEVMPLVVAQMDDIIDTHVARGHRGVIHAVSYTRAKTIKQLSRHGWRMIIHSTGEKQEAIDAFLETDAAVCPILLSPAVGVGEDFGRGDNCRYQIFPKYPVPNVGDPIVKARAESDPESVMIEADMSFIQAVGRGMRSEDDYCTNYLLDSGGRWRFGKYPEWFRESIVEEQK